MLTTTTATINELTKITVWDGYTMLYNKNKTNVNNNDNNKQMNKSCHGMARHFCSLKQKQKHNVNNNNNNNYNNNNNNK